MKKLIWLMVLVLLVVSISVVAYPKIDFRSVSLEDQKIYNKIEKNMDEKYYDGINKIIVYGREMWGYANGMYFLSSGMIMIDKGGIIDFEYTLKHELTHNKCWKEKRELSHDSQCFTNGLD